MLIPVDRDAPVPLSRQIATYLEELIRRGHLPPGTQLPATRTLARMLDVNRKTVETAYEELAARRLVSVRPGRAATVRTSIPERPELDLPFRPARGRDPFPGAAWATPEPPSKGVIDLAGVTPRLRHFPAAALRRFHEEALAQGGPVFTPPPPLGEAVLRRAAAGLLAQGGVLRAAEEIAVFASRAEAFAAVLDLFVPAGALVLLDAPVDPEIGAILRERGVPTELLPAANDSLASALAEHPDVRLLVATTGPSCLPAPPPGLVRRRALLDAIRERHLPLLEDVTGGEHSPAPPIPPLAALDPSGRVLPLCDLSDEVGGDLTAAVLAVTPKALERLRARVGPTARRPDRLSQRVLAGALEWSGRARVQRQLRERRRLLAPSVQKTIRRRLPSLPEPELSSGADAVLLRLPEGLSAEEIRVEAASRGVLVRTAADCGVTATTADFLMLDLTRHEEGEILLAIRALGEIAEAMLHPTT
jgi:GntR family transcriptional regulator/MocR family aminotransferase